MKKKIAVILLTLCAALSVQADVLIYKLAITNNYTGNGKEFKVPLGGRLVFDPDSLQPAKLITWGKISGAKVYRIECPKVTRKVAHGLSRTNGLPYFTALYWNAESSTAPTAITLGYLRGMNEPVPISLELGLDAPRVMRGFIRESVHENGLAGSFEVIMIDASVLATYLQPATQIANDNLRTVADVTEGLGEYLRSVGYTYTQTPFSCP